MSELKFSEKWEAFRLEKEITQETFVSSGYSFVDDLEEFVRLQIDEHDLKNSLNKCFDDLFLQKHLEQQLAKLREDNEKLRFQLDVAEAVLSVQVTRSALAYFEDKIKSLENNVTEN